MEIKRMEFFKQLEDIGIVMILNFILILDYLYVVKINYIYRMLLLW